MRCVHMLAGMLHQRLCVIGKQMCERLTIYLQRLSYYCLFENKPIIDLNVN